MKLRQIHIKILFVVLIILYFVYTFRETLFSSFSCKHLYNTNSFQTCALSNKTCNITLLLNAYFAYRTCVIGQRASPDVDYIVFDAVNGLGNRILGLIAVTTYALVTSRVALINWKAGDNHPVSFEDLFIPLSSSEKIAFYHQYSLSRLTNLIRNRWINEIERETQSNRIPRDWAFYFDREILCEKKFYNRTWLRRIGFSILNLFASHSKWIRTDQYFVPLLTRNEKMRPAFMTLFQNGQIFAELSRRMIHPVEKVNLIIQDFQRRNNLKNKTFTIGVHMRTWSSTINDHIEPYEKCIKHVIQNISRLVGEEIKVHLYIISNTPKRRQLLENRISKLHKNLEILHPPDASEGASAIENMQYTLAELLILSKMQYLILTSKSTFGMVAQGFARKGAWIVRQGASQEKQNLKSDLCEWESSSEPEYQIMESRQLNHGCSQHEISLANIGERTTI